MSMTLDKCARAMLSMVMLASLLPGELRAAERVDVIAGSGYAGITDGAAQSATFLLPAGLAVDRTGNLLIADQAAQRVRMLTRTGQVVTIAGSGPINASGLYVDPGYQDGPAHLARFNGPSSVVSASNGDIYVADTYNHVIRKISGGVVSTFAGATSAGNVDGGREEARFQFPRSLCFDGARNLYVADLGNGVRKIDTTGKVTTLSIPVNKKVTSVSIEKRNDGLEYLVSADIDAIVRTDLRSGKSFAYLSHDVSTGAVMKTQGGVIAGFPYALAPVGDNDAFVTDLRTNSVRYLRDLDFPYVQYLAGTPLESAPRSIQPPHASYQFRAPMGIVANEPQSVTIADSGNRRIVRISGFEFKRGAGFGDLSTLQASDKDYRIAIVGDSYTWHSTNYAGSVADELAKTLERDKALSKYGLKPRVVYFQRYISNYIDLLGSGIVDYVVTIINAGNIEGFSDDPLLATGNYKNWQRGLHDSVRDNAAALLKNGVPSLVVINPFPWELSPNEELYRFQNVQDFPFTPPSFYLHSDFVTAERNMLKSMSNLPVPVLDLWPAFRDYERRPNPIPLYNTDDWHFAPQGRMLMGRTIANQLETLHPWAKNKR